MSLEVRVEIVDGRIAARPTHRFPGDYDMSKAVPGGRWNKEGRYWHYPLTMSTARVMREIYGDMLVIGPNLWRWASQQKAAVIDASRLSSAADARLDRVAEVTPRIAEAMNSRKYQRVGARFIADYRTVLLADEPSLGKTIQYLGGIAESGLEDGPHLIVAPKSSLYSTWANEITKWTDWQAFAMPEGKGPRTKVMDEFLAATGPRFLVVNFRMLSIKKQHYCMKCDDWVEKEALNLPDEHWIEGHSTKLMIRNQDWPEIHSTTWNSICVDEAHKSLLGIKGGKNNTQEGHGYLALKTVPNGLRVAATGTPLKGKALNFWSTFHWLRPDEYTSKWGFAESFLEIKSNGFGKTIGDILPYREDNLYESLKTIMLRRTKREVQPDLPEDVIQDHWVLLEGKHKKQYDDLVLEGETEIDGGSLSTQGIMSEYTRQKQFAFGPWKAVAGKMMPDYDASPKMDWIIEQLAKRGVTGDPKTEFRLEGGYKYIIGSQFTDVLTAVEVALRKAKIDSDSITGAISGKRRDEAVARFQSPGGPRVLLVSTTAGGTSLTLDAVCDEMFILDETWVYDEQFQLEGRIKNRDVEKRVATRYFHYVRTRGTIEEEIASSGLTQDEFQKTLLDRSRGRNIKRREIAV